MLVLEHKNPGHRQLHVSRNSLIMGMWSDPESSDEQRLVYEIKEVLDELRYYEVVGADPE